MRILLPFLFTLFVIHQSWSQPEKRTDFSKVDNFALNAPDSVTKDINSLAAYLTTTPFTPTTEKKIRAIFVWVSQKIQYDDSYDLTSPFTTVEMVATQNPDVVLGYRKGVCSGYAQLFVALAQAAGLKAEIVEGIIKQSDGTVPRIGHAWVAVRLRKKTDKDEKAETLWYLCDPTWASPQTKGEYGVIKEEYFLVQPEDFIIDHMPLDPMWQLLEKPVPVDIFSRESSEKVKKYASKTSKNAFVFQDTINRALKIDSLKRLEKATWRMLHYNPVNEYIWFEVGKVYSNRFNALEYKINSLIQNSLNESNVLASEEKFENMLSMLRVYSETFKDCFSKIDDDVIKKHTDIYSEQYLKALFSAYRSGFQTAVLNKIIESNNKKTPRLLESIESSGRIIDSTLSSARRDIKSLDSNSQKNIESYLQYFEKRAHQKRAEFLFQHLEYMRMNDLTLDKKRIVYDMISQGKFHTRKYQECSDSLNMIILGKTINAEIDPFFDNNFFLFEVEECALNSQFLFQEIDLKTESSKSEELIPYIQSLQDASACPNFVKDKWRKRSKSVEDLININAIFFQEIDALNEMHLGYLCHQIAISKWNENLDNVSAQVKNDIIYYLNSADININKALKFYKITLKQKSNVVDNEKLIQSLEDTLKEILKLKKDAE